MKGGPDWPEDYVPLAKPKESWPEDRRNWPSEVDMALLDQFPCADGNYSWWPIIQVVPKEGSQLKTILGVCWVAYCMVQIVIYEIHGDEVCMIGWTNRWAAYQPIKYSQAFRIRARRGSRPHRLVVLGSSRRAAGTADRGCLPLRHRR